MTDHGRCDRTDGQEEMCLALWQEMIGQFMLTHERSKQCAERFGFVAGYEARQKLLTYCTGVVDENLSSKRKAHIEAVGVTRSSPALGQFEEEVLVSAMLDVRSRVDTETDKNNPSLYLNRQTSCTLSKASKRSSVNDH